MKRLVLVLSVCLVSFACSSTPLPGGVDGGGDAGSHDVPPGGTCHHPDDCVTAATCVAPDVCATMCNPLGDGGSVCPDGGECDTLSIVGCCPGCSCEAAAVCKH